MRKELVQMLIVSKVDYGNIIVNPIPKTVQSRLQKAMNAAAGFEDCIK